MSIKMVYRKLKIGFQNIVFKNSFIYQRYLGNSINLNLDYLSELQSNRVLKNKTEIDESVLMVKKLKLPVRSDKSKNWDTLIAFSEITKYTGKDAFILDAGAEIYSMILPWLFLSGYKNLFGINIIFSNSFKRGPIHYDYGDITHTNFSSNSFDAITCLSVIEHGVDINKFFLEMNRILKPNGILVLSTDYFDSKINTTGKYEYGHQIKIFCRDEIEELIKIANENMFSITSNLALESSDKAVRWERFNLDYTYICLTLKKEN